jgi:hypothetical protein
MLKQSLAVLALAGVVSLAACEKNETEVEGTAADTAVVTTPAPAAPVVTDTMAAPMTDTAVTDSAAVVDSAAAPP